MKEKIIIIKNIKLNPINGSSDYILPILPVSTLLVLSSLRDLVCESSRGYLSLLTLVSRQ